MKTKLIWTLSLFNALLGFTLIWRLAPSNTAVAQVAGAQRIGECLLIPGEISAQSDAVVYVVDTTNGTLGAMYFDGSTRQMQHMPAIDLQRVFASATVGNTGNNNMNGNGVPRR